MHSRSQSLWETAKNDIWKVCTAVSDCLCKCWIEGSPVLCVLCALNGSSTSSLQYRWRNVERTYPRILPLADRTSQELEVCRLEVSKDLWHFLTPVGNLFLAWGSKSTNSSSRVNQQRVLKPALHLLKMWMGTVIIILYGGFDHNISTQYWDKGFYVYRPLY